MSREVLVLYYSQHGSVRELARWIAKGIELVPGVTARLRTVPKVSSVCESVSSDIPDSGPPYVELSDLEDCAGIAFGSPVRFGNMAASLKYFIDSTAPQWLAGTLAGKPVAVFTSSSSMHGGQESSLLSMALPFLHHGMVLVGIPYTETEHGLTKSGGTPYGASHVSGPDGSKLCTPDEIALAQALGKRLAIVAMKLAA